MSDPSQNPCSVKPAAGFTFFPDDWVGGTRHMTLAARGLYIDLLAHQWRAGSLPSSPAVLARIAGVPEAEFALLWDVEVSEKFEELPDGRFQNQALERRRTVTTSRQKTGQRGGQASGALRRSKSEANGQANSKQTPKQKTKPPPPPPPPPSASPSPPPQEETRVARSQARAPRTDGHGLVIQHWESCYQERYGKRYAFRAGKDGSAVKACLGYASGDVGEVRDRIDRLFREPFWGQKGGLSLTILMSQWNELATEARSKKNNTEEFIDSLVNPTPDPQAELIRAWLHEPR